jgi:hypothetical protein
MPPIRAAKSAIASAVPTNPDPAVELAAVKARARPAGSVLPCASGQIPENINFEPESS